VAWAAIWGDPNHEGVYTRDQWKAYASGVFNAADSNRRLSRSEFVDKPNPFFARYDRKGTCRVTLDDLSDEPATKQKPGVQQWRGAGRCPAR
jgi:hypothetical protein